MKSVYKIAYDKGKSSVTRVTEIMHNLSYASIHIITASNVQYMWRCITKYAEHNEENMTKSLWGTLGAAGKIWLIHQPPNHPGCNWKSLKNVKIGWHHFAIRILTVCYHFTVYLDLAIGCVSTMHNGITALTSTLWYQCRLKQMMAIRPLNKPVKLKQIVIFILFPNLIWCDYRICFHKFCNYKEVINMRGQISWLNICDSLSVTLNAPFQFQY